MPGPAASTDYIPAAPFLPTLLVDPVR